MVNNHHLHDSLLWNYYIGTQSAVNRFCLLNNISSDDQKEVYSVDECVFIDFFSLNHFKLIISIKMTSHD